MPLETVALSPELQTPQNSRDPGVLRYLSLPYYSLSTAYFLRRTTTRRGKGEGSIYRRKDGLWVGQYETGAGKKYIYGKTKKDVAAKLAKAIADRDNGTVFDAGSGPQELPTRPGTKRDRQLESYQGDELYL